ncbi:MAG TPA: selenium cofactor biosynthesis protein YqeC [Anaerolineae bacterium]|nr:selenium cofactor biosynthesis protein YqeC [Anaerolineae bacterium]
MIDAFGIRTGEALACVGAGGKTSLCWRLAGECRACGRLAIFTTTTHMLEPVLPTDMALVLSAAPQPERIRSLLTGHGGLVLARARLSDVLPDVKANPVAPARPVKLAGLPPAQVDRLIAALPSVTWLIEADGARGRGLKMPASHEPVIPTRSSTVAVVAHLDTIGLPLGETSVHRAGQAAAFLGAHFGDLVEAGHVVRLMTDPNAGLKGIPQGARIVGLLTQRDAAQLHPQAHDVAGRLLASGRYERVVVAALQAARPVLKVFPA